MSYSSVSSQVWVLRLQGHLLVPLRQKALKKMEKIQRLLAPSLRSNAMSARLTTKKINVT